MANDFSADTRCKALWRFETGALTADSKGTNTLTAAGAPAEDLVDFKEGACCADIEYATTDYFTIADAALGAGFPLKSGDVTKKLTWCAWIKQESQLAGGSYVLTKHNSVSSKRSLGISTVSNVLHIECGYNAGASYQDINTSIAIANGEWYHVAAVIDGVAKTLSVRVYRVSNDTVYTYSTTISNEINVEDAEFRIGARDGDTSYRWDGKIDEVIVFNDLLAALEIDLIRSGTFGPAIFVPQVLAQVEYTPPASVRIYQLLAQVEYTASEDVLDLIFTGGLGIGGASSISSDKPILALEGGYEVGGDVEFDTERPDVKVLEGGFEAGSAVVFNTERPGIRALIFEGGLAAGGINPVDVVRPTAADITLALALTGGMNLGGNVVITNSNDYFDSIPTTEVVFQGGLRIGGWPGMSIEVSRLDGTTTRSLILSGGFNIEGDTAIEVSEAASGPSLDLILGSPLGDGLAMGGELIIGKLAPRVSAINLTGGLVVGSDITTNLQEIFETWALTGHEYEPALWTGFHFNSYCVYRGQVYAANDDGVFLLGGTDDDGTVIHPGVRIGPANYGTDQDKRIRTIRVGGNVDGAKVRVANEDGDEEYYDVERGRVTVSKGLQGRELTIDIMDFERLDQFEMVPLVMSKHWR